MECHPRNFLERLKMARQPQKDWVVLSPPFPECSNARYIFRSHVAALVELLNKEEDEDNFNKAVQELLHHNSALECLTSLRAALCVITDLARQRWSMRVNESGDPEVRRPQGDHHNPSQVKAHIRSQELVKRNEQLRRPPARQFITGMERKSFHDQQFVSIYSLFRDGRELAESLRETRTLKGEMRINALKGVVDPYLQFVEYSKNCEHTGFRLQDIWRYFRHTWSNQYSVIPGRSMAFIIRDRARKFHPVIGIGSLGSPIIQIRERDTWIGWEPETFLDDAKEFPPTKFGSWLCNTIEKAIDEIYLDDFIEEELLSPEDLRKPKPNTSQCLIAYGEKQRKLHYRLARSKDLKQSKKRDDTGTTKKHWQSRAKTHLYRSKRALLLAEMLRSRMVIKQYLSSSPSREEVHTLLNAADGRQVVKRVLRKAKADRVGIAMADITVCGAVAPYNIILGGKLVSMLATSPEVVAAYRKKYASQESEIASSMAGRPIIRQSNLVLLGTTSLYGIGSSQYNRLWMHTENIGGKKGEKLAFIEIGKSKAFGTSHFSSDTVNALVSLVQQSRNGQRVNSIFGEGVSPKLRKIRDGLDALHLPVNVLLNHGRQRIVYGIPLIRNLREFLLGIEDNPDYLFDLDNPKCSSEAINRWWTERWLSKRIESDDILKRVKRHTLIFPIRHGARVVLPQMDDIQFSMFDELVY